MAIETVKPGSSVEARQEVRTEDRERWVVRHDAGKPSVQEAMRFLPAGDYQITGFKADAATLDSLVLRAIPELIFCKFQYDPLVPLHGPYDWVFLEKHVLAHVNCIVGSGADTHAPLAQQWKQRGGRWIVECGVPALDGKQPLTADEAFAYWSQNPGFQAPHLDGVVVDEFLGHRPGMKYPEWTEAVRRIRHPGEIYPSPHLCPMPCRTVVGVKFKYADWIRQDTDEIVAVFGEAKLVRRLDGKAELRGGTDQNRVAAKEWIALFWHEAALEK